MVTMFLVGSWTSLRVAYSVVVFPEPVGPVHSSMPSGDGGDVAVALGHVLGHAQIGQADQRLGLVEEAQRRLLAVHGRHDRDAEVDRALVDDHAELAVLGAALLDDVELGHHLDPAHDRRPHALGQVDRRGHGAVDAIAHPHVALGRLDVHVGCPLADRLGDDPVDHLHHRSVVVDVERFVVLVVGVGLVVAELEGPDVLAGVVQDVVGLVQLALDVAARADPQRHLAHVVGDRPDRLGVEGIGGHQLEAVVVEAQREDVVLAGELFGNERDRGGLGRLEAQVGERDAELAAQRGGEAHLVEETVADQHLTDAGPDLDSVCRTSPASWAARATSACDSRAVSTDWGSMRPSSIRTSPSGGRSVDTQSSIWWPRLSSSVAAVEVDRALAGLLAEQRHRIPLSGQTGREGREARDPDMALQRFDMHETPNRDRT